MHKKRTPSYIDIPYDPVQEQYYAFDSHAHLTGRYFAPSTRIWVLERMYEAGVDTVVNVCLTPEMHDETHALYTAYPNVAVYSALGIHPCDVTQNFKQELAVIKQRILHDPRCIAIGETGLDACWAQKGDFALQVASFTAHIALAKELNLPLILHAAKAEDATYSILIEHGMQNHPIVWHCYTGNLKRAIAIVEAGWYISFSGIITYPTAHVLRETLRHIPLTQLLIETDAPYLAPQPRRGHHCEPAYVLFTAHTIAQEYNLSTATLIQQTKTNACKLFTITSHS